MTAVNLRVKILEAQNRKPELESFLDSLATGTTSIEQAEEIETLAQQKSLETVRQHAIEKQATLTTDPVTRLQLRYALIHLYEGRKDFAAAQKNVEALYHENPKILGVVRSTVDFYWRMKMHTQAIAVLLQASKDAYPALSEQFTYEAARKSTEAKQFQQARESTGRSSERSRPITANTWPPWPIPMRKLATTRVSSSSISTRSRCSGPRTCPPTRARRRSRLCVVA